VFTVFIFSTRQAYLRTYLDGEEGQAKWKQIGKLHAVPSFSLPQSALGITGS